MTKNLIKNISSIILIIFLSYFAIKMYKAKSVLDEAMINITKLKDRNKAMEDSIRTLNALNQNYILEISKHRSNLDSISKVKNKIIVKYRDQKNFVNDASINELDSIIRANTGIKH